MKISELLIIVGGMIAVSFILFLLVGDTVDKTSALMGPTSSTTIAGQSIPDITGYVSDGAEVLNSKTEAFLTDELTNFAGSGYGEIAVVTVKSLNGLSVEEFGIRLGEKWKVGKQGKDDGIIIIISSGDRKVRIETGRGSVVTDSQAGDILDNYMVPKLKTGDWSGAVVDGVDAIIKLTSK